jgi:hypothetical protein
MVFVRFLGVLDLLGLAALLLLHYNVIGWPWGFVFAIYFILKGFIFNIRYIVNMIDVFIGIYMLFLLFTPWSFVLTFVLALHILIKTAESFVAT